MLEPGDRIDIWVIDKRLGAGGMGSVYRCHNHAAKRILAAVKILEGHIARHPEARARFIREAEILFTLEHPHIVKVRNVRVDTEQPYIEMEFVKGESLEDRLARDGGLPLDEALPLMGQLASALAYLHERGVRHRDIKPANILIDDQGTAKLVDFGLAMEADASRLTQGHMSFGTVSYAPPEWVEPENLDPVAWDLYALGVVFWEMLTGAVAFPVSGEGDARQQAFQVILKKQGHPPLDPGEGVPDTLRALIADMTLADRATRLTDARQVLERLQAMGDLGDVIVPRRPATPPPARRVPDPTIVPPRASGETFALDEVARPSSQPTAPVADDPVPDRLLGERETLLHADIEPPDEARPRRRTGGLLLGLAGVLLVLLVGAGGLAAAMTLWLDATRPLTVQITGLDPAVPFDLLLDDRLPTDVTDDTARFSSVEPGDHTVHWVVGAGCEAVACARGRCPDWCLQGERALQVERGEGEATAEIRLAAPAPRPVRVGTSDLAEDLPVAIAVEGVDGAMEGRSWRAAAVRPGLYRARVIVGVCPEGPPCEDACPPGCRDVVRDLPVPLGETRHEARLQVRPPEPAADAGKRPSTPATPPASTPSDPPAGTPAPEPVEPDPDPEPAPAGQAGPAPLVTHARFARWLRDHPEWHPEAARADGRADANYLFGWDGLTPPAGADARPVENVPHLAARAYCRGRGGLPQTDDPPTTWDEGAVGLGFEWRLAGDQPANLEATGSVTTMVGRGQALLGTGFRCVR